MMRMGLTGGIGSGKSTVGRILIQEGLPVLDLDQVGRDLCASDPRILSGLNQLSPGIVKDGVLDRKQLQVKIFENPELRKRVERVLHPPIVDHFESFSREAETLGHKMIFCEAALLIEGGFHRILDGLVVVMADEETRWKRVQARDNISREVFDGVLSAQVQDDKRRSTASFLIENNGSLEALQEQVNALLARFRSNQWM